MSNDRSQVGIGTLIVFAMVLVASIAAGVLVETAGFLQSQSEEIGEQTSQLVTDRLPVISARETVTNLDVDLENEVSRLHFLVKKASGVGDIDVSHATIRTISLTGSAMLTYNKRSIMGARTSPPLRSKDPSRRCRATTPYSISPSS